jgi:hypothetical protein
MSEKQNREERPWSEKDLMVLENAFKRGKPVTEIADLVERREDEIWRKIQDIDIKQPAEK